jgi:hypothetical protein
MSISFTYCHFTLRDQNQVLTATEYTIFHARLVKLIRASGHEVFIRAFLFPSKRLQLHIQRWREMYFDI